MKTVTLTRAYGKDEEPKVGDVVQMFVGAFSTAVVTEVRELDVVVERVHCSVSTVSRDRKEGQLQMGVERVTVSKDRLRSTMMACTRGDSEIDNRNQPTF